MTLSPDVRRRFEFFREHAGYRTPPGRLACALELARVEAEAEAREFVIEWDYDDDVDISWDETGETARNLESGEWEYLFCRVVDPATDEWESVGGVIVAPGDPYMRVTAAELASELLYRLNAEAAERRHWEARDVETVGVA